MTHLELRQKFLKFWQENGHAVIPSAPLVPDNDPTTLFTGSGMQPLIPYLLGQKHPLGKRLVNVQKCFRGQDIEEVGDNRHDSFFEMMGNWSLGDYFKQEQLSWYFQFLTNFLGLPKEQLYVTCFAGNDQVPRDNESEAIWKKIGIPQDHIFFYGSEKNWWSRSGTPEKMPPGEIGGPDSEVYFEFPQVPHDPKYGTGCHPACDCGRFIEIGNSVFIQYQKTANGSFLELPQRNVDFGGGLERTLAAINCEPDIFKTDLYLPLIQIMESASNLQYNQEETIDRSFRIIADHLKAAVFLVEEGIRPGKEGREYVLRRLIRRATYKISRLGISPIKIIPEIVAKIVDIYSPIYFDLSTIRQISSEIEKEINLFSQTLNQGEKLLAKRSQPFDEKFAFDLYQSYGYPLELTEEIAAQQGITLNRKKIEELVTQHKELSRTLSAGIFKGGLADHSEITTKYHTATHLLHAALRKVLGPEVQQAGSNITHERLRFDFTFRRKLTDTEITQVQKIINDQIAAGLKQKKEILSYKEAIKSGALAFFQHKYPEKVTVYSFGDFSREICNGPHVENTKEIGNFVITKHESVSANVKRIYGQIQTRV